MKNSRLPQYINLFRQGRSFTEIAKECGVSRQAVYKELKKHKIVKRKKLSHKEALELANKIAKDWESGRSKLYMSQKYKLQQSYIVEYARRKGCSPRPCGKAGVIFEYQAIHKEKIMFNRKRLRNHLQGK